MSNELMPPNDDSAQDVTPEIMPRNLSQPTNEVTPQIARFPNPIPTTYEGYVAGRAPRDQNCQERISQEVAEVLDTPVDGEPPLPVFNR